LNEISSKNYEISREFLGGGIAKKQPTIFHVSLLLILNPPYEKS
jgi:hypothetical protein